MIKIANESELRKEALRDVNGQIQQEIEAHSKEMKTLIKNARGLNEKLEAVKEALKNPDSNKKELELQLKNLTAKHGEYDQLLTEARVKEMTLGQKLITDHELSQALIMNSPIWETLFPQEKNKAVKLMLKRIDYSAVDGKIALTLNHGGLKFIYLLLHPELQKAQS